MRVLFVDDEPSNVEGVARTLREGLDIETCVCTTVESAVAELHRVPYDVVVADVFMPMGDRPRESIGPRARRHLEHLQDLGGLVLMDELDRLDPVPLLLAHTACIDPPLVQLLAARSTPRVRKPAPFEVLLQAVLEAVRGGDGR